MLEALTEVILNEANEGMEEEEDDEDVDEDEDEDDDEDEDNDFDNEEEAINNPGEISDQNNNFF